MNKLLITLILFPQLSLANTYAIFKGFDGTPFYLLPVAHIGSSQIDIDSLKISLMKEMDVEPKICVEVSKKVDEKSEEAEKLIVSPDNPISKYIDFANYNVLAQYLGVKDEFLNIIYENYTPYFLYELVKRRYMSERYRSYKPIDDELMTIRLNGVNNELQTTTEIASFIYSSFFNELEWRSVLLNQVKLIKCNKCIGEIFKSLDDSIFSAFKFSDLESSRIHYEKMMELSEGLFIVNLLTGPERNRILSERIIQYAKSGKCNIFLIGIAHFGGVNGLEKILASVKKINIKY